jgi:hypothetical protein
MVTTDYKIEKIDQPEWPTEGAAENTEDYELWLEELNAMEQAMYTTSVNEYTIGINYRYEYKGYAGKGER